MGLLQKAVETYDFLEQTGRVGKIEEGKAPVAPVSHIITRADIEITINSEGQFVSAREVSKDEDKIIIPVTERSVGRVGGAYPHPICDQLWYIAPYNEEKNSAYIEQLKGWADSPYSHPKLAPILRYVKAGTILVDLAHAKVIEMNGSKPKNEKALVRWRVLDCGEVDACWQDVTLFRAYEDYYQAQHEDDTQTLCMITGKEARLASQHPKGIVAVSGNAKLISSNDTRGFTYMGRFTNADQAVGISYEASQKAHNALRWLVADQGAKSTYGGRTFICWNPEGHKIYRPMATFLPDGAGTIVTPSDYQRQLQNTLNGWKTDIPDTAGVVIAAFDAATSGRLSLTYYNELMHSDFIRRLHDWDEACAWYNGRFGIQSPSLWQIVNCAFGTQQGERLVTDERVLRQQMQRLVACRIDSARMPADIMRALYQRASTPLAYSNNVRLQIRFVACAVIKKYHHDHGREWDMTLEKDCTDRSYLFGRLLAVLEKIEKDTYGENEDRDTNAIRLLSIYSRRPFQTYQTIYERIRQPYMSKLNRGLRKTYDMLIEEITEKLTEGGMDPKALNKPLKETYLLGYYLQQKDLYISKKDNQQTEDEQDD
ncbi:MAG: type I-C CRISPR-associated protein Cas8c/Csd1 [Peptococcaceae bacterium]|nr:type I-C CRISPR-associated protein Cas8c/Csd1 [Peptococcaceae bacterium]